MNRTKGQKQLHTVSAMNCYGIILLCCLDFYVSHIFLYWTNLGASALGLKHFSNIYIYIYIYTVKSLNKGHFGTNINSSKQFVPCIEIVSFNRIILNGGLKFGDLVLSNVERYLIVSLYRRSTFRGSTLEDLINKHLATSSCL